MILSVFLQAAGGGGFGSLLPLLLVIVVMYFFFFRPQIKRQKEEKNFQNEISKGMRIVTTSGIHGKILDVEDTYIILESENSRLRIDKSAISKSMSAVYLPKEDKKKEGRSQREVRQIVNWKRALVPVFLYGK